MLNIVIAQVGESFQQVLSIGEQSIYLERALLNNQANQIYDFFKMLKPFEILLIQKPLENDLTFD